MKRHPLTAPQYELLSMIASGCDTKAEIERCFSTPIGPYNLMVMLESLVRRCMLRAEHPSADRPIYYAATEYGLKTLRAEGEFRLTPSERRRKVRR